MAGEFDIPVPHYPGLYIGYVVDRSDPEGLGRVRIRVPGLLEPASAWAWPLGTVGGGSRGRGFYCVPDLGAECGVLFHAGDIDHPYFLAGHWGRPDGEPEVPTPVRGLPPDEAPQLRVFETGRFLLGFDDRNGREALRIEDKVSGDQIVLDGFAMAVTIKATSSLSLQCDGVVSIEGVSVVINGRPVLAGGGAI